MDKDSIWGGLTAAELLADAKMLEAMGSCACFDFRDHQGEFSYVCKNHPTPAAPEAAMPSNRGADLLRNVGTEDLRQNAAALELEAALRGDAPMWADTLLRVAALTRAIAEWQSEAEREAAPRIPHFVKSGSCVDWYKGRRSGQQSLPAALASLLSEPSDAE